MSWMISTSLEYITCSFGAVHKLYFLWPLTQPKQVAGLQSLWLTRGFFPLVSSFRPLSLHAHSGAKHFEALLAVMMNILWIKVDWFMDWLQWNTWSVTASIGAPLCKRIIGGSKQGDNAWKTAAHVMVCWVLLRKRSREVRGVVLM